MSIYQIIRIGDPVLREKAAKVPKITPNILKLLDNMADTMYNAGGVGLAAPQIGISKRVIFLDTGDGPLELINPEIKFVTKEIEVGVEGCLSLPGVQAEVERAVGVKVHALNREGKHVELEARKLLARALQHEIDHLNGILISDKALRVWNEIDPEDG